MEIEIKFKAWHKEQNQMYWFDIMWGNYRQGGGYIGMVEWGLTRESETKHDGNQTLIDPNNCELMQYTGLKDINSKEIYLRDIVKAPSGNLFEVIWYEEEMRIALKRLDTIYNFNVPLYEVIGNIYENPELLTP